MADLDSLFTDTSGTPAAGSQSLDGLFTDTSKEMVAPADTSQEEGNSFFQNVKDIGLSTPMGSDVPLSDVMQGWKRQFLDIAKITPLVEAGMSFGSQLVGMVPAGVAGAGALAVTQDPSTAASAIESGIQDFTYQPQTEGGKRLTGTVGKGMAALGQGIKDVSFVAGQGAQKAAQSAGAETGTAESIGAGVATVAETVGNLLPIERAANAAILARKYQKPPALREAPVETPPVAEAPAVTETPAKVGGSLTQALEEAAAVEAPKPAEPVVEGPPAPTYVEESPLTAEVLARQQEGPEVAKEPLPKPASPEDEFNAAVAEVTQAQNELKALETEDARVEAVMETTPVAPKPEEVDITEWEKITDKQLGTSDKVIANVAKYAQKTPSQAIPVEELPVTAVMNAGKREVARPVEGVAVKDLGGKKPGTYIAGPATVLHPDYWMKAAAHFVESIRREFMPNAKVAVVAQVAKDAEGKLKPGAIGWSSRMGDGVYAIGPRHLLFFDEVNAGRVRQRRLAEETIMSPLGKYNEVAQVQAFHNLVHETGHAILNYYTDTVVGFAKGRSLMAASRKGLVSEAMIADLPAEFQPVVREFNRLKQGVNDGTLSLRDWLQQGAGIWRNAEIHYLERQLKKNGLEGLDIDAPGSAKTYFDKVRKNSKSKVDYELSLPEYIAEQTSRYAHAKNWENRSNLGTERFFQGAIKLMREYFARLKKEEYLAPHTSFVNWLESMGEMTKTGELTPRAKKVAAEAFDATKGKKSRAKARTAFAEAGAPKELVEPSPPEAPKEPKKTKTAVEAVEEAKARFVPIEGLTDSEHAVNLRRQVLTLSSELQVGAGGKKAPPNPKDPLIKEMLDLVNSGQHEEVARRLSEIYEKEINYDDLTEADKDYTAGTMALDLRSGDRVQLTGVTVAGQDGLWVQAEMPDGGKWWYLKDALQLETDKFDDGLDVVNTLDVLAKAPALKKPTVTKQELEAILKNPQFKTQDKAILRAAMRKSPAVKGKYSTVDLKDMVDKLLVPFSSTKLKVFATRGISEALAGIVMDDIPHPFVERNMLMVERPEDMNLTQAAVYARKFTPELRRDSEGAMFTSLVQDTNLGHKMDRALGWVRAVYQRVKFVADGPSVDVALIAEVQSDIVQQAAKNLPRDVPKDVKDTLDKMREVLDTPPDTKGSPYPVQDWWFEIPATLKNRLGDLANSASETALTSSGAMDYIEGLLKQLPEDYVGVVPAYDDSPYWADLKFLSARRDIEDRKLPRNEFGHVVDDDALEKQSQLREEYYRGHLQTILRWLEPDSRELTPAQAVYQAYLNVSSRPYITLLDRAIAEMKSEVPSLQGIMVGPREWLTGVELWNAGALLNDNVQAVLKNHDKFRKDVLKRYPGSKELQGGWIYVDVQSPTHEIFYDEVDASPEIKMADAVKVWGEDHNAQLRGMNRLKLGFFQLQQLAHMYPNIEELNFANAANSKYNRVKGMLHAPAEAVTTKWMNGLAKEMQSKVGHALQREYENGAHWTTLQQTVDAEGKKVWRHSANEMTAKELKQNGIDVTTPDGAAALDVYLGVKNAIAHQMDYLERVLVKISERARQDPNDVRLKMQEIRSMPFFPQTRFGNYIIEVVKGKELVMRQAFEGLADWNAAKVKIAKSLKPGEKMVDRVIDERRGHLQAIPQEFLAQLSNALELSPDDINEVSSLMASFRAMKALRPYDRAQARVRGADPDALRRFVSYAWHNGNLISKMEVNSHFRQALKLLEKKEKVVSLYREGEVPSKEMMSLRVGINRVKNAIETTRDYLMYPPNEAQALRGWMTFSYLAANIKAALVNMTGYMMTVADLMAREGPLKGLMTATGGVYDLGQALQGKLSPETQRIYDRAVIEGVLDQSYAYHLASIANAGTLDRALGNNGMVGLRLTKVFDASMLMFRVVEQGTRRMTFLTEYKSLRKSGMSVEEAYKEAVRLTDLLQNSYTFGNRPVWMRGVRVEGNSLPAKIAGGAVPTLTLFMSYMQHAAFHAFGGYEVGLRRRAGPGVIKKPGNYTAYLALMYLGMAGITGLPGAEDVIKLAKAVGRKLYGRDVEMDIRNTIKMMGGDPVLWMHGLTHNINLGFGSYDVSSSVGLGRLAPGVSTLTGDEPTLDKLVGSVPAGSLFNYTRDSIYGLASGTKTPRQVMLKAPGAVGHVATAWDWIDRKGFYDLRGQKIMDREPTTADIMMRALGFQPSDLSLAKEKAFEKVDMQMYWQSRRTGLTNRYAEAFFLKDREALKDVKAEIAHFNRLAPEKSIQITAADLANSMRQRAANARKKADTGVTTRRYTGLAKDIDASYTSP